jgi:two-component system cell cycle response regulator
VAERVLVIEDNATNLALMGYLLRAFGYEVDTATTGEGGLEAVRRQVPDLIVCDIQMPGIDGYEVAIRLKAQPAFREVPLVAVTAYAMVGDREQVLGGGFDGYIAKPIDPTTFVTQLRGFLDRKGSAAPAAASASAAGPRAAAPAAPTVAAAASPRPDSKRIQVLVVDDSQVNRTLMRSILEPFGYEVCATRSAAEGLTAARRHPPDMIISDIHMPEASGFQLLEAVRADATLRTIPFLFLSATLWIDRDFPQAMARGADGIVPRPVDPQTLLSRVGECLRKAGRT